MENKIRCSVENAPMFLKWIQERGGILRWRSVNLSNPGASWSSPAVTDGAPTIRPSWQCDSKPELHVTSTDDVIVEHKKEYCRFGIKLQKPTGFNRALKLTDSSSEKVRSKVSECHEKTGKESWHEFDYASQEAVIFYADKEESLTEWVKNGSINHVGQTETKN